MSDESRYRELGEFLDAWMDDPSPKTVEEMRNALYGPTVRLGMALGCIAEDDGKYILKSREMIDSRYAVDSFRFIRMCEDLASTMRTNRMEQEKFDRTAYSMALRPEHIGPFRELCKEKLAPVLRELDDWLREHSDPGGIRAGVSMFQFDEAERR